MLGPKRIRKNYYKNSSAKRRVKIISRIVIFLKMISGIAVVLIMSFGFIFGYDLLTQCEYFKIRNLNIEGNRMLTREQVAELAKINENINIFSVNLSITRKKLLANPWIAAAEVIREIPDRITLKIKEHKPVGIIDLGKKYIINVEGEVFKELKATDAVNLPVIKGLEVSDLGDLSRPGSIQFMAVMQVLELGQNPESIILNRMTKEIRVDREMGLTLYMSDGIKSIKLGFDNFPDKYNGLKDVLIYMKKRPDFADFVSIDLNNLNRIVLNPVWSKSSATDKKGA